MSKHSLTNIVPDDFQYTRPSLTQIHNAIQIYMAINAIGENDGQDNAAFDTILDAALCDLKRQRNVVKFEQVFDRAYEIIELYAFAKLESLGSASQSIDSDGNMRYQILNMLDEEGLQQFDQDIGSEDE